MRNMKPVRRSQRTRISSDEFTASDTGVNHHCVISGVEASGVLGFFYQRFGSSNIGNAFLASYETYLKQAK